jgi:hypothetical protein
LADVELKSRCRGLRIAEVQFHFATAQGAKVRTALVARFDALGFECDAREPDRDVPAQDENPGAWVELGEFRLPLEARGRRSFRTGGPTGTRARARFCGDRASAGCEEAQKHQRNRTPSHAQGHRLRLAGFLCDVHSSTILSEKF